MEYPKPIMSITELEEMGFTRSYLKEMAHRRGQNMLRVRLAAESSFLIPDDLKKNVKEC